VLGRHVVRRDHRGHLGHQSTAMAVAASSADVGRCDDRGMRRSTRAINITDAAPSRAEELHHREVRYITMMCIRALCLILATVLVVAHAPLLGVWIPILLVATLVVPWLAVILANERPRKRARRPSNAPDDLTATRALTRAEDEAHPIIDVDPF
jgi:Flp pilus assembly protein TadB